MPRITTPRITTTALLLQLLLACSADAFLARGVGQKHALSVIGLAPLKAAGDKIHMIALTREDGKNEKLKQALAGFCETVEVPCIAHADGPDLASLPQRLQESWDYVIVTSPEAAKVVASAWDVVADNPPPVAAVGKATEEALNEFGIQTCFTPSKATAATLVVELPGEAPCRILYPASCKARKTLEDGLVKRGFEVVRLDTYDTVTASWTSEEKEQASRCDVACFASPSSVKGWLKNTDNNNSVVAACIGETSATACREMGWAEDRIFFPEKPGIEGWVEAVEEATQSLHLSRRVSKDVAM